MKAAGLEKTRAVIFDFDGTLAILNIDFNAMREKVFSWMKTFDVEENAIREKYLLEIVDEVYPMIWKMSPSQAIDFYHKAHRIMHDVEMRAAENGGLIPGTKEALQTLRGRGIKVGIITRNCEEAVQKVFPDIDHFCDILVSREAVKKVKPHPDHLSAVMKALQVSGEESVMVGDHMIDIQAGKRAGMKTVGVLTGRVMREEFEEAGADYVLSEASEICGLLEVT